MQRWIISRSDEMKKVISILGRGVGFIFKGVLLLLKAILYILQLFMVLLCLVGRLFVSLVRAGTP